MYLHIYTHTHKHTNRYIHNMFASQCPVYQSLWYTDIHIHAYLFVNFYIYTNMHMNIQINMYTPY